MRGSAQSFSGWPVQAARRAAWQGESLSPVHPLQTKRDSSFCIAEHWQVGRRVDPTSRVYRWAPE